MAWSPRLSDKWLIGEAAALITRRQIQNMRPGFLFSSSLASFPQNERDLEKVLKNRIILF